jgi:hypothetical protein
MGARMKEGSRVRIKDDGDGAEGTVGIVQVVFKSGRLQVGLPCGGFRNLRPDQMEEVKREAN